MGSFFLKKSVVTNKKWADVYKKVAIVSKKKVGVCKRNRQ